MSTVTFNGMVFESLTEANWDSICNFRSRYDAVREFVRDISQNITVWFREDEFFSIISDYVINVTFNADPLGDRLYSEFLKDNFNITVSPFLMGILHEIGHIFTYDKKTDRERDILYYILKQDFKVEEFESYTKMYFAIPAEFNATKWGVEYYLSHKDFCDNFVKEMELCGWINDSSVLQ